MAYTTINKSSLNFNTKLFTGDGSSSRGITGVGFQPDWVWLKARSKANSNILIDAVRGQKRLRSDTSGNEADVSSEFISFDTDGFTVTENAANEMNNNSTTYAAWNWKAGTGAGSSNTDGSINTTSTSVNSAAGFSISTYTGYGGASTIGHGLGAVPKMIIVKKRSGASYDESWYVYHEALGNTHTLGLNSTGVSSDVNVWNDTTPTSSVFSVGNDSTNRSGNEFVAYCFAEKQGYSKFGSYKGNGSADGTFVYTGFKPAFIIIKGAISGDGNAGQHWELYDNKRLGYNVDNNSLLPSSSGTENTGDRIDLLSNGFKIRINSDGVNDNNSTYIYMAFGQSLVGSNNVPCTAR